MTGKKGKGNWTRNEEQSVIEVSISRSALWGVAGAGGGGLYRPPLSNKEKLICYRAFIGPTRRFGRRLARWMHKNRFHSLISTGQDGSSEGPTFVQNVTTPFHLKPPFLHLSLCLAFLLLPLFLCLIPITRICLKPAEFHVCGPKNPRIFFVPEARVLRRVYIARREWKFKARFEEFLEHNGGDNCTEDLDNCNG